jgi:hypothetical protein
MQLQHESHKQYPPSKELINVREISNRLKQARP